MPDVIALSNGRVETCFGVRDFEYLIDKYLGYDAVRYFRELMAEKDAAVEELQWEHAEKIMKLEGTIAGLEAKLEELDCDKH